MKYWYDALYPSQFITIVETPTDKHDYHSRRFLMKDGTWIKYLKDDCSNNRIYIFKTLREAIGVLKTKAKIKVTPTRW